MLNVHNYIYMWLQKLYEGDTRGHSKQLKFYDLKILEYTITHTYLYNFVTLGRRSTNIVIRLLRQYICSYTIVHKATSSLTNNTTTLKGVEECKFAKF